jgi:hypothetical protein
LKANPKRHWPFTGKPERDSVRPVSRWPHSLGRKKESDEALNELEAKYANGFSTQIAEVHGWRGEHDAAFAALDCACTQSDAGLSRVLSDPVLRPLHADPRWAKPLDRLAFTKA